MIAIKVLIVENELLTAERIRVFLEKNGYVTSIVSSGEQALQLIKTDPHDIVLMDIHLDGKIDGITTARSIKKQYPLPVIFITQLHDEEIFNNAKETIPQNYITKPFTDSTLLRALELAIINQENTLENKTKSERLAEAVFIPTTSGVNVKLILEDILYIKASGAYSEIFYDSKGKTKNSFHKISLSSNHVVEQLAYPALTKVHRSYHVNIHKIEKIQKSSLFIQGNEIPIAEEQNNMLKKMLLFFRYDVFRKS